MPELTAKDLLKVQRRATHRGFYAGLFVGALVSSMYTLYTEMHKDPVK